VQPFERVRLWYRDRDFPEIKASNAEVLLTAHANGDSPKKGALDDVIAEHNYAIQELQKEVIKKEDEIKHLKIQISIFKIGGQECRNKDNV